MASENYTVEGLLEERQALRDEVRVLEQEVALLRTELFHLQERLDSYAQ